MGDVVGVKFLPEVENEMVVAIKATIYSFAGKMSIAAALGALAIAKHDLEKELLE